MTAAPEIIGRVVPATIQPAPNTVQVSNVLRQLADTLPDEMAAVVAKIVDLETQLADLRTYAEVLRRIDKAVA